jgi:peptidoglycan/LPS O-acetylase OafA/YrhL
MSISPLSSTDSPQHQLSLDADDDYDRLAADQVHARPGRPKGYLPTLDGWRALSIMAVILCHDSIHSFGSFSTRWFHEHGDAGVDVFFAISGILICSRLLDEEHRNGRISIVGFYIRRVTRIIPPALLYLCVVAGLSFLSVLRVGGKEWLGCLLFYRNYSSPLHLTAAHPGWYTGHFWSLSVEEHFYLLLPALLVFTKKRYRIASLALLGIVVAINCAMQLHGRPWTLIRFHTDVRLNSLLIPATIVVIVAQKKMKDRLKRALQLWPVIGIAIVLILSFWDGTFWQVFTLALLMPFVVLGTVLNPNGLVGRFLELKGLRYIGRISYSLYLWQQMFFINHLDERIHPLGALQRWPLCLIALFGCAIASYHLIERPTSRGGHLLAKRYCERHSFPLAMKTRPMAEETS